ncbi:MAG: ArsR family transcriptional regulator [Clostridiaceae bacterium]|jgi:ArsR family transcriptional regulator|nr:ArsR family transcriptional regulator [Clostridiaceae bacterium]
MELVQILKALGDEISIRILNLLKNEELCSGEIEYILGMPKSKAIEHLNKLFRFKIIIFEKKTQWVYYKINEDLLVQYPFLKEIIYTELNKIELCKKDTEKLLSYKKESITCGELNECRNIVT